MSVTKEVAQVHSQISNCPLVTIRQSVYTFCQVCAAFDTFYYYETDLARS